MMKIILIVNCKEQVKKKHCSEARRFYF